MHTYFVRYTGEIGTKNKSARWSFIDRLGHNVRCALRGTCMQDFHVKPGWDYLLVRSETPVENVLACIPGIRSYSAVVEFPLTGMDALAQDACEFFREKVAGKTFAVRCRKPVTHHLSGREVERRAGELLAKEAKVNLDEPQVTCHIELKEDKAYFHDERVQGMCGLPLGTQGRVLTLMSGGIDSPVAGWYLYRTGMDQDFLYFDLGGDDQRQCVLEACRRLKTEWGHGSKAKLYIIDFLPVVKDILLQRPHYQNLLLKYCFYKTAEKVAGITGADALATGESVGQVSTQTLKNLSALDQAVPLLILRPLSTFTKEEIIRKAEKIGTFGMSYKGKEYCALAVKNVSVGTSPERLAGVVKGFREDVLKEVFEKMTVLDPSGTVQQAAAPGPGTKYRVVIDLRDDDSIAPLFQDTKKISFQQAWAEYPLWDKTQKYLVVCGEGSRSALLAAYMKSEGFDAEAVNESSVVSHPPASEAGKP